MQTASAPRELPRVYILLGGLRLQWSVISRNLNFCVFVMGNASVNRSSFHQLPLKETCYPADVQELTQRVQDAVAHKTPVYPIGGGTSLGYGVWPKSSVSTTEDTGSDFGLGLYLTKLNRVIDYPAKDLTITVEAGITMAQLADVLAAEQQCLPIDVPDPEHTTLGGVISTDFSSSRRFAHGTMRDFVIGVSAVSGHGRLFRGGGRVVKNVAGYDFCKLLTGALGTLGVVTQVTLKVKPISESHAWLLHPVATLQQAEHLLAALVSSRTSPTAVDLLVGPHWQNSDVISASLSQAQGSWAVLAVRLEGSELEVDWMLQTLQSEWAGLEAKSPTIVRGAVSEQILANLTCFTQERQSSQLVGKASLMPSRVVGFVADLIQKYPACSLQSHAASGIVKAQWIDQNEADMPQTIEEFRRLAVQYQGHAVVMAASSSSLTRQQVWGPPEPNFAVMQAVKDQLDPSGILNPGRFLFAAPTYATT